MFWLDNVVDNILFDYEETYTEIICLFHMSVELLIFLFV